MINAAVLCSANTRTASSSIACGAPVSLLGARSRNRRPSHLDTTQLVTTTTSPSRSHGAAARRRRATVADGPGQPDDGQDWLIERSHVRGRSLPLPRSHPARNYSAVAFGSVISSGTDRTVTPSISAAWSPCRAPASSPVSGGTARRSVGPTAASGGIHPDNRKARIGHAAQRFADDRRVADDRAVARNAARTSGRPGWRRC